MEGADIDTLPNGGPIFEKSIVFKVKQILSLNNADFEFAYHMQPFFVCQYV